MAPEIFSGTGLLVKSEKARFIQPCVRVNKDLSYAPYLVINMLHRHGGFSFNKEMVTATRHFVETCTFGQSH